MSYNQDDDLTTSITTTKENNHPTSIITNSTNEINKKHELIHRDHFVDPVTQNQNKNGGIKTQ